LVVSGIWPPDVGGPAVHAPEVAGFLRGRGHEVDVVITADRAPEAETYPLHWTSRASPPGVRHLAGTRLVAARARRADVVYATGMFGRASLAARIARRPIVLKLVADPAFERARRLGLWRGSLADFQSRPSLASLPLRAARTSDARRAAHVVTPSSFLRELVLGWGVPPDHVTVLPNPAPEVPELPSREELRGRFGIEGTTLVFAGRLAAQKSLEVGIEAAKRAGVPLLVAGDGPERAALEALGGARFLGPLSRRGVLELFRAGDAALLSSSWENFPHSVVEALAVGTPVIATRTGGVAEVVRDGENGLLVEPGDPGALAEAIRRFVDDPELAGRLRLRAAPSVGGYAVERIYGRLEEILLEAAG